MTSLRVVSRVLSSQIAQLLSEQWSPELFLLISQAVTEDATSRQAPILVTGNNVEVTEPLKEYIEKKMVKVLDKVLM